jgi:Phosphatidylinositol-4-phosphate 5-Kinase
VHLSHTRYSDLNPTQGKRSMEQVAVMQNIFYNRKITKTFDLKGSLRGRFASNIQSAKDDSTQPDTPSMSDNSGGYRKEQWDHEQQQGANNNNNLNHDNTTPTAEQMSDESGGRGTEHGSSTTTDKQQQQQGCGTLLDGDFLEFTQGRPVPLTDRAKAVFQMSILNDTLFLSIINVLDYSILVGVDEENMELVVGIIDFMRQYDILKQMERVGKSLPMVVGSEAPTIIQPPLYKSRFTNAMERYFMTVPSKWTQI